MIPQEKLHSRLRSALSGKSCLVGLGNLEYGDDGAGIALAQRIRPGPRVDVMVVGNKLEQHLHRLTGDYHCVLFIDAVDFAGAAGEVALFDSQQMKSRYSQFMTHKMALGLVAGHLESRGVKKVLLLGIQPQTLVADRLSAPVNGAVDLLLTTLNEVFAGLQSAAMT